ncbi:hypothetical protein HC248_03242 [Polaromonas vacuolata]|uniref:Uncharacterized protein n=1 Tax=Polaromonas vacuolata TaxID=37448 RepID=A0A6H2HDK3_9BURK|nr:hypothetical protein HC248_03242 [Polaromonas vacuolata]
MVKSRSADKLCKSSIFKFYFVRMDQFTTAAAITVTNFIPVALKETQSHLLAPSLELFCIGISTSLNGYNPTH